MTHALVYDFWGGVIKGVSIAIKRIPQLTLLPRNWLGKVAKGECVNLVSCNCCKYMPVAKPICFEPMALGTLPRSQAQGSVVSPCCNYRWLLNERL